MPYKSREKQLQYLKEYSIKNKEYLKEKRKEYCLNNLEKTKEQNTIKYNKKRNWYLEYFKKWKEENRDKISFYNKKRKRKNINGSHTLNEWNTLKAQYNYTCPCCGKSEPEIKLTEDHIIPISKGGSNNIDNIQPLCGVCNSKKHTKIIKY